MNFVFVEVILFSLIYLNTIEDSDAGAVICYYGSWAKNRPSNGKFAIEDINPQYCSIIIYCCIGLNEDGTIRPYDAAGDLPKFVSLKNSNPNVKLLTTIGGPNEQPNIYSKVAASSQLRLKFLEGIVMFLKQYKLDGSDFMWEYPYDSGDKDNFVIILQMLRIEFDVFGWMLTAAVGTSSSLIESSYDVLKLNKILDYIIVKSFDYYTSSDPFIYVHAPLFAPEKDLNRLPLTQNGTIWNWLEAGADRAKIILGLSAFGRSFQLANENNKEMLALADGPGPAGPYSGEKGMLTYLEICEKLTKDGYSERYYEDIQASVAHKGLEWIGFENIASLEKKATYAKLMRLGGVMLYWIDGDDKAAICGNTKYPLLETLRSVFPISEDPPVTTATSGTPSSSTSKPSDHITKEEAKSICTSRKHGSSFANPPQSCTSRYYRCIRIMHDDFFPREGQCQDLLVFDESLNKCNQRENVGACRN